MNTANRFLASLLTASVLVFSATASHAAREPKPLPDFTVFIDPPTGFVFVKLPQGWRFVGQVRATAMDLSTSKAVTELLQGEDDDDVAWTAAVQEAP